MTPAAERRTEYRYEKRNAYYGMDMAAKPKPEREQRVSRPAAGVNPYVKINLLIILVLGGVMAVIFGIMPANYEASVQQEINQTIKDIAAVNVEIESLEIQVKNVSGISYIESRAIEELGMIYPAPEQFVFITNNSVRVNDFAQYIKENAYELW
ncbi:MAG: septum formation initiator family protein [Clostridiales Family XIII bacterium]|jgi:cell division protein FtsL|nr:septum formation initiator family protein [Clostridiales Family XIII bacterium]